MNKLTIAEFIEQVQNENLDYALNSEIITGSGVVYEEDQTVLCTGEAIYNFIQQSGESDENLTASLVRENIDMLISMQ